MQKQIYQTIFAQHQMKTLLEQEANRIFGEGDQQRDIAGGRLTDFSEVKGNREILLKWENDREIAEAGDQQRLC